MASKERKLEILKYKLDESKKLLNNWIHYDISEKKIEKLKNKISRYENEIAEIENS